MQKWIRILSQVAWALLLISSLSEAKEIALTFDDAPFDDSSHFKTEARTDLLIRKLKALDVPPVIVFANPCRRKDAAAVIAQLKKYKDAGHIVGNHTCSHPRLDDVGFVEYAKDSSQGDRLLAPLFSGKKYFRFPFLNEGKDVVARDQMREWLDKNHYQNGMVSVDDEDYLFSFKINRARKLGKKIDYKKVEKLFVDHLVGAAKFYDDLAVKSLGYSPKHVLLLHEMDATVMFIDVLVKELRAQGWKIINAEEAYRDPLYATRPINTYAGNGIVAQITKEKTGSILSYDQFDKLQCELDRILGLKVACPRH